LLSCDFEVLEPVAAEGVDGDFGALLLAPDDGVLAWVLEPPEAEPEDDLPLLLAPADDDEPAFIMSSNSVRLSCPSLFLSALSKSMRAEPELDLPAPAEALPPEDALPVAALPPEAALPEDLALLLCDVAGFACASLFFDASFAYADALAKASRDMLSSTDLIFMRSPLSMDG
jgi:hypothetical protein